jgi:DnaJ homolog subfamily C member 1
LILPVAQAFTDVNFITQTVVVFLALLTSAMQYAVQTMTYKTDLERVNRFIREAKLAAWGANLVPVQGQRKVYLVVTYHVNFALTYFSVQVRVSAGGPTRMDENGRESSGRLIDLVVDEENVYIVRAFPSISKYPLIIPSQLDSDSGELHVLDASAAVAPSISRLWTWKVVANLFHTISDKFQSKAIENTKPDVNDENLESDEAYSSTASEATGKPLGPAVKVAGGRRRKVPKRR